MRFVVPATMGPSAEAALSKLLATLPNARIVRHEALADRPLADAVVVSGIDGAVAELPLQRRSGVDLRPPSK